MYMRLDIEQDAATFPLSETSVYEDADASGASAFDSLLKSGIKAAQEGDRAQARYHLVQAAAIDPGNEDAWMWLASISEYPEELLAFLNRVLDINPENAKAAEWRVATRSLLAKSLVKKAVAAFKEESHGAADQYLEQALKHDEECETAWFWKAALAKSDDQKVEYLGRILEINPNNTDAANAVAEIKKAQTEAAFAEAAAYAESGNNAAAYQILDELVKTDDDSVRESVWMLKASMSSSDDEKVEYYDKVLTVNPKNQKASDAVEAINRARSFAAFEAAKAEAIAGNQDRALELLGGYLADTPDSLEAWLLKSHLSHQVEEKVAAFERALEIDPQNAAARSGLDFLSMTFGKSSPESTQVDAPDSAEAQAVHDEVPAETNETDVVVATETAEPPSPFESKVEDDYSKLGVDVDDDHDVAVDESTDEAHHVVPESSVETAPGEAENEPEAVAETPANACPYCFSTNDPHAFECGNCHAGLSLSDIDLLFSNPRANTNTVQLAVTKMEADWNLRDFSEQEMTALGIGHFNLQDPETGLRYLREAARLNPDNVILAAQVNAVAIRLDELYRKNETQATMPKGKTILVVDDSPTVRKLISGKLEKSGHTVVCAVDGIDALNRIEEGMPDLILLDITMPRMDGYEVCKRIRTDPAAKNLPIVMISGKDGFFDKVRGRMAGSTGYVTKPFGPETLMKALDTYLVSETSLVD